MSGSAKGFNSKRMAIIFWKAPFRASRIRNSKVGYKDCSAGAAKAQLALSRSHVEHLLKPLEAAGFAVDVLLLAQSCGNSTAAVKMHEDLVNVYNSGSGKNKKRVVEVLFYAPMADQFLSSKLGAETVLEHLRSGVAYESLLFWRFDEMSHLPLHNIETHHEVAGEPAIQSLPFVDQTWDSYRDFARQYATVYLEDNVVSIPGWAAPCMLYPLASRDSVGMWADSLVLNTDSKLVIPSPFVDMGVVIYRGPLGCTFWGGDSYQACQLLHHSFGGDSCEINVLAQEECNDVCTAEQNGSVHNHGGSTSESCFRSFWNILDDAIRQDHGEDHDLLTGSRDWSTQPPRQTTCAAR